MNSIPLISRDAELCGRIEEVTSGCRFDGPEVLVLSDPCEATDYLRCEMPELIGLHFPEQGAEAHELLETIMADPWLVHGGIIALCDDDDTVEHLENLQGANIVVVLSLANLTGQLPRVLDIIHDNRRILFQREIGTGLLDEISGHFTLDNDPLEARCYTNLVCNFLYYSNRIDASSRDSLNLAMYEILINAIEHGNCGITYEDKTAWLRDHGSITGLIEKRHADPEIARRRVVFEYTISRSASCFFVGDEGAGFDWRGMEEATGPRRLLEMHGRGILLARSATRNLTYNEKGNEVRFELAHQNDEASLTPSLLDGMAPRKIAPGEFVFREDDPGNFLYYIVKGRYDVLVGDRIVAGLSPEDIFLGEMSFLLNNRRSASVRARSAGKLIEISKKSFVDAIREHPHYALLLSRLLAQRIERSNKLLDR